MQIPCTTNFGRRSWSRSLIGVLLTLAGTSLAGTTLYAQDDKPTLQVRRQPKDSSPLTDIRLRALPDKEQKLYLYATNPTKEPKTLIVVVKAAGVPEIRKEVKVPANKEMPVPFDPAPMPMPAKKPEPFKLQGPPFKMQFELLENKAGKEESLQASELEILIRRPWDYVTVSADSNPKSNNGDNELIVKVDAKPEFVDPPCTVKLVLPPERIPGLEDVGSGTFQTALKESNLSDQLGAKNIKFKGFPPKTGFVYLTVDGYERTFILETDFAEGGRAKRMEDPCLRLNGARFVQPAKTYPLRLEVDNLPQPNYKVALEGRANEELSGFRKQEIRFRPEGKEGVLAFTASIQDWVQDISIADAVGPVKVQVRLLDNPGGNPVEVLSGDNEKKKVIDWEFTIDKTPPDDVKFVEPPEKVNRTLDNLKFTARGADKESGIESVRFFWGEPVKDKDGKEGPPGKTIAAESANEDKTQWTAALPVKGLPKGTMKVSVEFVNGAGLKTFATETIELIDPPPPPVVTTGKIRVQVYVGSQLQRSVEVVVKEDKKDGMEKDKQTAAGKDGAYLFENLPPGTYKVSSSKGQAMGEVTVKVEVGKTAEKKIELLR